MMQDQNSVVIFDIKDKEQIDMSRSLTFFSDEIADLKVKISENFESTILVNKSENYLLSRGNDE